MSGVQHREHWLRVSAQAHDRDVAICVEDSGEGIPSRSGSRLALCHDIVSAHGGRFTMMASAAGGASFKVILPGS
jgi:C4-dicarboxylate-specific signal transduction histidine kinase